MPPNMAELARTNIIPKAGGALLLQKFNRRLPINLACKVERIPVRQADTAVRGCLADMIWIRSSVDAITLASEGYPHQSDWIIWTWVNGELLVGMDPLKRVFRI